MKVSAKEITLKNGRRVVLRSATVADAENVLQHLRTTHRESYRNLIQSAAAYESLSVEAEEKILSEFETSKSKFLLVADFEGRIVGGLGFIGQQAEFYRKNALIGMSIQQEFTNSGLGTEMIKYMLSLAKDFGFHRVELTVRTFNMAGIALYEKSGFERTGLLKEVAFIDGQFEDEYSYQIIVGSKGIS